MDYGRDDNGVFFAVSRKYYTNETVRNETIDLLMSRFGISQEVAGNLYFTEYGYEFTSDEKQFAVTFLAHYDMNGVEIHSTIYDNSSEATAKTFAAIPARSNPAKGLEYAKSASNGNASGGSSSSSDGCNSGFGVLALVGLLIA